MRKAKILATVGPASRSPEALDALLTAGVDAFRVNFSHGRAEEHREVVANIRAASRRAGRPVAILGDLSGPKIRCGTFASGPVELTDGQSFTLTSREVPGDRHSVSCTYPLWRDLHAGDFVLLDDGLLRFRVVSVHDQDVDCVVEVGGPLSDRKGINVPGAKLSTPALTEKDARDAALAKELGVDWLALSFVRRASDLVEARALVGPGVPLVAKIEKPEAVTNLEEIIAIADGIMVARGDLGVELGSEKVPLVQKRAIKLTNAANKLVITATQMLDSMIRSPRPTRAEAADVANAILDGTDVVMLSGETASGKYPVEAVRTMNAIICEIEGSELYLALERAPHGESWDFAHACAASASQTTRSSPTRALVVFTREGHTADLVAEYLPHAEVLAVTPTDASAQRLALQWGLRPVVHPLPSNPMEAIEIARRVCRDHLGAKVGDTVGIVSGSQRDVGTKYFILDTLR